MRFDPNRDVADDEKRLWPHVREQAMSQAANVRVVPLAKQHGVHPQRARQIVRTWGNDGLVVAFSNGNYLDLTEKGRETAVLGLEE